MKRYFLLLATLLLGLQAQADGFIDEPERYTLTLDLSNPVEAYTGIEDSAYYVIQNYGQYDMDIPCWVYEKDGQLRCAASSDLLTGAAVVKCISTGQKGRYYVQFASGRFLPLEMPNNLYELVQTGTDSVEYILGSSTYGMRLRCAASQTHLYGDEYAPYIKVNATLFSGPLAQFRFFKVLSIEERADYSDVLQDEIGKYFTTNVGSYFAMSQAFYEANAEKYADYLANGCTYDEWKAMAAAVKADVLANEPESGWYRIRNRMDDGCMGYGEEGYGHSNPKKMGTVVSATLAPTNASTPIYLEKQAAHVYTLLINGSYLQPTPGYYTIRLGETAVGHTFAAGEYDMPGYVCLQGEGSRSSYPFVSRSTVDSIGLVGYKATTADTLSYWRVEDAAGTQVEIPLLAVGDSAYATAFVQYPARFENVNACSVCLLDTAAHRAYYEALDSLAAVPAATPVLLIASASDSVAVATVCEESDIDAPADNSLQGTYIDVSANAYVLAAEADTAAFCYASSLVVKPANTAYLTTATAGKQRGAFALVDYAAISGVETIDKVDNCHLSPVTYDLYGRRVNAPQRGVFIVNGKKIIR